MTTAKILFVESVEILGTYQTNIRKHTKTRYGVIVKCSWNTGKRTYCARDQDEMFRLHRWTLETFPEEAGLRGGRLRLIPKFPERSLFKRNSLVEISKLVPKYSSYYCSLIQLTCVQRSGQFQAFFTTKPGDPLSHKEAMSMICDFSDESFIRNVTRKSLSRGTSSTSSVKSNGNANEITRRTSFDGVKEVFY